MSSIQTIARALREGALASVEPDADPAVREMGARLKRLINLRHGPVNVFGAELLVEELRASGAGADAEVVELAERIVALLPPSAAPDPSREAADDAPGQSVTIGTLDAEGDVNFINLRPTVTIIVGTPGHAPPAPPPGELRNPYKGLAAFEWEDAGDFHGREALVERLWMRFRDLHRPNPNGSAPVRLLAVVGPSGCGKSSLVRAGLVPALVERPVGGGPPRVAVLTPGRDPVAALDAALAGLAAEGAEGNGERILLVDQFEEVYTHDADEGASERFVERLLVEAGRPGGASVLLAIRTDFIARAGRSERLSRLISEQGVMVPVLSRVELRDAIAAPARDAGLEIDAGTVERLAEEALDREGVLPLLQVALTQIWEGLARGVPAAETFERIGGVGGALATCADTLFDGLCDEADRALARRSFLRMVQISRDAEVPPTRRRMALDDLVPAGASEERARAVLERFAGPGERVLTFSAADGTETVEITHEALFEHWDRLRTWIEEDRADLLFHDRLAEAARHWLENRRHVNLLWRPPDLDRLRDFHARCAGDLSPLEAEFHQRSEAYWRAFGGLPAPAGPPRVRARPVIASLAVAALLAAGGWWALTWNRPPFEAAGSMQPLVSAPVSGSAPASRTGRAALECARAELGDSVREAEGDTGGPRVRQYLAPAGRSEPAPWSAAFVSWCFAAVGGALPFAYTASADSLYREFERNGWTYHPGPDQRPQPGDIAFWRYATDDGRIERVAIVDTVKGAYFEGIEGDVDGSLRRKRREIHTANLIAFGRVPDAKAPGAPAPRGPS